MYVRATKTRTSISRTGEAYFTHRLVKSERVQVRVEVEGVTRKVEKVRQVTLLNLGRHFEVPSVDWPQFCTRMQHLLGGQSDLIPLDLAPHIELAAQRYAALLQPRPVAVAVTDLPVSSEPAPPVSPPPQAPQARSAIPALSVSIPAPTEPIWVDASSQELSHTCSVGVESLALHAIRTLEIDQSLQSAGFNSVDLAAAIGQIVARMAYPASERQTHAWLQQHSALGELWGFDYGRLSLTRLYKVGDKLIDAQAKLEGALYQRVSEEFGLEDTFALYDLTNTYFEGLSEANPLAKHGYSKEKRSDCALLTLALVLDSAGFVRRSEVFAGNIREAKTLQSMLQGLNAPAGAMVVVDRGLVSEENLNWLKSQGYRYMMMTQERLPITESSTLSTAQQQPVHWQRIVHEDGDVRLICHSPQREVKETAMHAAKRARFEQALEKLRAGLTKPRGTKDPARLQLRIGKLLERYAGLTRLYTIKVLAEDGKRATAIEYSYQTQPHSRAELPGHYTLRSNDHTLDGEAMWRIYIQLTEVESAFRSLKSELGLRPIHHQLAKRCKAHLWISVLAYQCVHFLRRKLQAAGIDSCWDTLRRQLRQHQRVTLTQHVQGGGVLHSRQTAQPSVANKAIYQALKLDLKPGGVQRRLFRPELDL